MLPSRIFSGNLQNVLEYQNEISYRFADGAKCTSTEMWSSLAKSVTQKVSYNNIAVVAKKNNIEKSRRLLLISKFVKYFAKFVIQTKL